ncbi:hypothetical protein DFH28DRAFT_894555, partial [Melampsora americana]
MGWFDGLLCNNAHHLGQWSEYADLRGLPFDIPELRSVPNFYKALVADFGDGDATPTANEALRRLRQGPDQSIFEFTGAFRALASRTSLSIDTQLEYYKFNLNLAIANVVNGWREWHVVRTLEEKMRLAMEGQVVVKNADDL